MQNTISFTPSNEQLIKIANEYPELNEQIKQSVVAQLQKSATKYIENKLQSKTNALYDNIFNDVQKNVISLNQGWSSQKSSFSSSLELQLKEQMEKALTTAVEEEFQTYLNSSDFQRSLRAKVRESILSKALKSLDSQILEETKKLIA